MAMINLKETKAITILILINQSKSCSKKDNINRHTKIPLLDGKLIYDYLKYQNLSLRIHKFSI